METVRRGDIVIAASPGAYGKPRPVLVVQDDAFTALPSVTVLPLTSDLQNAPLVRITVEPESRNGLQRISQVMIDKAVTLPRSKIGRRIGQIDAAGMRVVDTALGRFLGLALGLPRNNRVKVVVDHRGVSGGGMMKCFGTITNASTTVGQPHQNANFADGDSVADR